MTELGSDKTLDEIRANTLDRGCYRVAVRWMHDGSIEEEVFEKLNDYGGGSTVERFIETPDSAAWTSLDIGGVMVASLYDEPKWADK